MRGAPFGQKGGAVMSARLTQGCVETAKRFGGGAHHLRTVLMAGAMEHAIGLLGDGQAMGAR